MALQPPNKKKTPAAAAACQQQQLLPDEVIEEIFMRLPARSVARCRCLSRAWAAALSSRGFINRHLDLASTSSSRRRFFFIQEAAGATSSSAFLQAGQRLTRSCRGLVLVMNDCTGLYYVYNPSTGQAASLPDGTPVKIDGGGARDDAFIVGGYASFGLGHDARADRHKVVRLYYPVDLPAGCEVYDVGVGSKGYWRPAASGAKPPCFAVDRFGICGADGGGGVFAQGRVHWLATRRRPRALARPAPDSVMSLSLVDETFTCTPLPPRARGRSLRLTLLHGGRLGLAAARRPRDVWTPAPPDDDDCAWRRADVHDNPAAAPYDELSYEESLEPVGRPYEDVLFASTSHLNALSMALRRLPARTLGRLKSVCRSWRAVIESDRFATAHNLEHQRRRPSSLPDRVIFTGCSQALRDERPAVPLRSFLAAATMMPLPPLMKSRVVVSKPCHGLAQVMSPWHGDRTDLFNPVTRAHRTFYMDHEHRTQSCLDDMSSGSSTSCSSIGLGYDQSRQEHVLVLLAAGTECLVWRLRSEDVGSAATVPAPPIAPRFLPSASTVPPLFIDGRIHWMCCSPRAIVAFCVRAGAFQVVPAPPATGGGGGTGTEFLVELRRLLCVVQSCPATETITIWSTAASGAGCRDEDGGWSREYVIQLGRWPEFSPKTVEELVVPMAIDATDGRILLDTGSSLGYYDPVRRTLETVCSLYGPPDPKKKAARRFFAAALWEESQFRPYDRCHRLSWC